jgi:DinB superfamily
VFSSVAFGPCSIYSTYGSRSQNDPPEIYCLCVDRCDACGFEYEVARATEAGPAILVGVEEFVSLLNERPELVRTRPEHHTWSPLEYGCHLRDVLLVQRERVLAALFCDRPSFNAMGRDERVELDGYAEQRVEDVTRQLSDAALLFTNVLQRLDPYQWDRRLIYRYPQQAERSLRWVAVHTLHEVRHHLDDVRIELA